ncbi:MAG TPA: hypothetical protein VIY28_03755 [Pseudonocardiaceae bacterium]
MPFHRERIPAPIQGEEYTHTLAGPDPGPEIDDATLRDLVESEAHKDAASGMYDINLGTHGHPLIMENKIDRWHHRWSAETEMRQQRERHTAKLLRRGATLTQTAGEQTAAHLEQDLQDACAYRDRMHAIVAGTEPGDDGGYWPAESRIDENRRWESAKDWAIYFGAAFAEIGLNYTAFQLMGSSLSETAVLAASIILVNVLLPKQLGELLTRVRRARRGRGVLLAGVLSGAALWVGVSLFVAQIRTAYLLLPSPSALETGETSLLERAGIGHITLTAGWLLVVLAVGTVVLLRSATRYNPYVKNLRAAHARVDKLRAALVDTLSGVVAARFDMERARESEADLAEHWAGKRAEQDGLAAELKHHYQHHLARDLGDPSVTDGVEIAAGRASRPTLPAAQNPGS